MHRGSRARHAFDAKAAADVLGALTHREQSEVLVVARDAPLRVRVEATEPEA